MPGRQDFGALTIINDICAIHLCLTSVFSVMEPQRGGLDGSGLSSRLPLSWPPTLLPTTFSHARRDRRQAIAVSNKSNACASEYCVYLSCWYTRISLVHPGRRRCCRFLTLPAITPAPFYITIHRRNTVREDETIHPHPHRRCSFLRPSHYYPRQCGTSPQHNRPVHPTREPTTEPPRCL